MLQQHTLRSSRGSGSVHDTAQVLRLRGNRLDRVVLTQLPQLLPALNRHPREGFLQFGNVLLLDFPGGVVDNVGEVGAILERQEELSEQVGVTVDDLGAGLEEGVAETFGSESVIGGDNGNRLRQCA